MKILRFLLFVLLSASVLHAGEKVFRAGAAVVDITPTKFPVIINGNFTEGSASKAFDTLHARSLVLDDGTTRIAFVVVDSCMLPRDLIDRAKDIASKETSIPTDRMLISSTHTHSAPSSMGCLGSRVDKDYVEWLPPKLAEAIAAAAKNLQPARIGWAAIDDWDHTFNRSWIRRSDKMLTDPFGQKNVRANMHPGYESPDAVGPSGPVDPGLSVLALQTRDGKPLAVMANYSQHYFGTAAASADYYGRFCVHIAKLLGEDPDKNRDRKGAAFVSIMSQGTSGDLARYDYASPAAKSKMEMDIYAASIAEKAFEAYKTIRFQDWVPLAMAQSKLSLKYRVPDETRVEWAIKMVASFEGRLPKTQPEIYAQEALILHEKQRTELKLQAIRIGDLSIAAIPNEVYSITGLKLKLQSPFPAHFNMSLANGSEGYIPPPEQHKLGGYTTWPARTAGLEETAEPKIVGKVLDLLNLVKPNLVFEPGLPHRQTAETHGSYPKAILESKPAAFWRLNDIGNPIRPKYPFFEWNPTLAQEILANTPPLDKLFADDASGNYRMAQYENGVAFYLEGAGVDPQTHISSPAFSGAQINRAAHFAGGRLRAPASISKNRYSVEFWFWNAFPDDVRPVTGYLFSMGPDGDKDCPGDHLGIGGTHRPDLGGKLLLFNGNAANEILAGKTQLAFKQWHHVALTRDGKKATLYLDGKEEVAGELASTVAAEKVELFFGGRSDNFSNFEGKMDEISIYDRALNADEIAAHYKASGMTPPVIKPAANRVNPRPLTPEESLKKIHLREGFEVEKLVAAEPLIKSPVAFDWDGQGRLWVVEMADYPSGMDGKGKRGGRVRILEDTDGDGRDDKSTLFADNLNFPNGILTWRDGALVTAAPDILFLRDTNGDGVADEIKPLFTGFPEGNQQLRVNGLRYGLDNWIYCASGGHHANFANATKIHSIQTGTDTALGSRDFRFKLDTAEFDPQSGPAQFGRNRDDWGNWFGVQNSWPLWHYVLQDHYLRRNPYVVPPNPINHLSESNPKLFAATEPEKRYHSFDHSDRFTSGCSGMIELGSLFTDGQTHAFTCEPVHNLVQHNILEDDGVTFKMHRDVPQGLDFFASEDHWCRPVMARSGPDGALYIADMYRYMIEHPEWLPQKGKDELLPFYREGENCGRIYRIYPKGKRPARIPQLDKRSDVELAWLLSDSNGWIRDRAQMMLLWRNAQKAVPVLNEMILKHANPLVRLHAACTLDGLNVLSDEGVIALLADKNAGVRVQASRLAETHADDKVLTAALKLVDDDAPKVRLQLAFSLGQFKDARAGAGLVRLLERDAKDPYVAGAVYSSALPHLRSFAESTLVSQSDWQHPPVAPVIQSALSAGDVDALRALIRAVQPRTDGDALPALRRYAVWLEALTAFNSRTQKSTQSPLAPLADNMRPLDRLPEIALRLLEKGGLTAADKSALGTIIALTLPRDAAIPRVFKNWLSPSVPLEDQALAVRLIARMKRAETPALLLTDWTKRTPSVGNAILDALMANEQWTLELLDRVKAGTVPISSFDAARQARLRQHPSAKVKAAASEIFAGRVTVARAEVIEKFKPALKLHGDAAQGKEVFAKLCTQCHRKNDIGKEIGPDLRSVVAHEPEKLLVSILDPSASIEPGFVAYNCKLRSGEHVYGIIVTETSASLTFKLTDGTVRDVLRSDVAGLRSTQTSLMPDGLETMLTPQSLADLIQYLKTP